MIRLTMLLGPDNSTVDGRRPDPATWLSLDFEAACLDSGFDTKDRPYVYLHVPHVNGETVHRVRYRWDDGQQLRIGGAVVGRVIGGRAVKRGAWFWEAEVVPIV